jgi:Zn-dependent peptidase ImmA (M78 family)
MRRVVGTINVLGAKVTVIETDSDIELEGVGEIAGMFDPTRLLILIDSRATADAKDHTLRHELGHALLERMGFSDRLAATCPEHLANENEEILVDKVMPAYADLLTRCGHLTFRRSKKS